MDEKIKRITDINKFIENLRVYGYEKYCTFLYYPNYKGKENVDIKKTVKLNDIKCKDDDNNKPRIDNNVIFLGLNAATRYKTTEKEFQTMHDISNLSNDYKIAQLLYDYDNQNIQNSKFKLSGSFAFDLLSDVITTNLFNINSIVKRLDNNKENIKIRDKYIDFKNLPKISYSRLSRLHDQIRLKKDNLVIKYENLNRKNNKTNKNDIDNYINTIKYMESEERKMKSGLLNRLYKHIVKYDLPYFNALIKTLSYDNKNKRKIIICFGSKTYKLASIFADICELTSDLMIVKITHYSAAKSRNKRLENLNDKLNKK
ncbi:hypothetical protein DY102_00585 [Apilactobacillus timberlakei]|uniref:hypothetical protein n=1 Tax=Apilactobacillus timberlakei TaxID=2008380 RepID=UPI00112E30AB|nr:hypothetical protein [Apilactobacillus timberlakei]TPR24957.1 hypothetical protein DY102_00585 [Apilactobacillus timberlakei]